MMRKSVLVILVLFATLTTCFATSPELNIVPWPQSLTVNSGQMALTSSSKIVYSDPALLGVAQVLANDIQETTFLNLALSSGSPVAGDIYLKFTTDSSITGEMYKVTVATTATVEAANYNAVSMGTVTLLQAIGKVDDSFSIPNMVVSDAPDAGYRGHMVDLARQYHTIDSLKDVVTMCRLYKIRYLQIHLTDDQAFTFPSAAYPTLAAYGNDYTLAELQELVAYADKRAVTIIPELEVPAHATCFTNSMPDLFASSTNGIINFADPLVWDAVKTIIDEMCDVFQSSPYFHLGADEANIWGLSSDPEFQTAFTTYGVDGIEGLFNYFISQLDDKIKSRGKTTVVWEGFNYGKSGNSKMDPDVHVMMFDNYKSSQSYMDAGHKVINASWFPLYVVGTSGFGVPADLIYDWDRFKFGNYTDPFPRRYDSIYWKNVSPTPNVPGAQMCSWEMPDENEIKYVRFRLAPFADRIWNPANDNGFEHFNSRFTATDLLLDSILAEHQPAGAPQNMGASDGLFEDMVRVGWSEAGNYPTKYAIYRNTVNNSSTATLIKDDFDKTANLYEDTDVVAGQSYYYWTKAYNIYGWSEFSAVATGKTGSNSQLSKCYEQFNYDAGQEIEMRNGGEGFSGAWTQNDNGNTIEIIEEGLTVEGLPTSGGAVKITALSDATTYFDRSFAGDIGYDMSNAWVSFIIKPVSVADGHFYFVVNGEFGGVGIGKKWGNGFGFQGLACEKLENGKTYHAVVKYDCRPGNDKSYIWINPSLDSEPSVDTADAFYDGGDIGLGHTIGVNNQGHGRGVYILDEIRIGSTWRQAIGASELNIDAPTPNPMTWANPPAITGSASATMACAVASDPDGVEDFF